MMIGVIMAKERYNLFKRSIYSYKKEFNKDIICLKETSIFIRQSLTYFLTWKKLPEISFSL